MGFYLVAQWTEKGIEAARQRAIDKVYGTREKPLFTRQIWEGIWKVTGTVFDAPQPIRQYFKENREGFCGGKDPNWNAWLDGDSSTVETLNENGNCRFFWMDCDEFDKFRADFHKRIGYTR